MTETLAEAKTRLEREFRDRTPGSAALAARNAEVIGAAQRLFGSTSLPYPLVAAGGDGPYLIDVDGNHYLDLAAGWNSSYLGRGNRKITEAVTAALDSFGSATGESFPANVNGELAARLCALMPGAERVLFAPSGSEANSFALRLARADTGRDKIVKFRFSYHGMYDDLMIDSLGTGGLPANTADNVLVARYNSKRDVLSLLTDHGSDICAIIVEPISVVGNVEQQDDFLQFLRDVSIERDIVLIFDEIITGFRFGLNGAAGRYRITPAPDLITLGKMIGGGMPVAAVVGARAVMDSAITASSTHMQSPICHAAALAFLDQLSVELYEETNALGERLRQDLRSAISSAGLRLQVTGDATNVGLHLVSTPVTAPDDSITVHRELFDLLRLALTVKGFKWVLNGFGITAAFTEADVASLSAAISEVLHELKPVILEVAPELA